MPSTYKFRTADGTEETIPLYESNILNPEIKHNVRKYMFIRKDGITYRHPLMESTVKTPDGWQKNKVRIKISSTIYTGIEPIDPKYKVILEEK